MVKPETHQTHVLMNIQNKEMLVNQLNQLQPDTKPIFGLMTAQHMIEHLALVVTLSNGKTPVQLQISREKSEKIKSAIIYTEKELPVGFKVPLLPQEELLPLRHIDLQTAIKNLMKELSDFQKYFELNPDAKFEHPVMGELNFKEWVVFHNKHFTHHFKQFGLI